MGVVILLLVIGVAVFAFATTIAGVNPPRLGASSYAVGPNDVKPSVCGGLDLTNLVTGNTGTGANDLIYASGGWLSSVQGNNGDDCIIVSSLTLSLNGGAGNDVCIGTSNVWWRVTGCETTYP
jgi:hypothetical protein